VAGADELLWSVQGPIGRVTLNRPDQHNALTRRMWQQLPRTLDEVRAAGAKVVLVGGSGSSFASGADLDELAKLDGYTAARDHWHAIRDCLHALAFFELPTVAVINGPCLGGGLLLAIACDLRYASRQATFSLPVARLGIVLDDENIGRLKDTVGAGAARELLFTAGTISSTRALAIGLVNAVVPADELGRCAEKAAAAIAANAPASIAEAKRSLSRCLSGAAAAGSQDESVVVSSYLGFHKPGRDRS